LIDTEAGGRKGNRKTSGKYCEDWGSLLERRNIKLHLFHINLKYRLFAA